MYSICLTNAVRGTALMLGLASSLPPHTRSLEVGEGMGGGTTDTASEYGGQVRLWVKCGSVDMRICGLNNE